MARQVCPECGAATAVGEEFCGQCGVFLEWDPQTVEASPQEEPAPAPAPESEPPPTRGLAERVKAAVGIGPSDEAAGSPPLEPVTEEETAARPQPGPVDGSAPAPVKPAAPAPRPRAVTPVARQEEINPGDLVCGHCGAGNKPDRRFCRRCGRDLSEAVVARIPWWRRVLTRRPKPVRAAGSRPTVRRRGQIPGRLMALVLVGALLVAGVLFGRGYVRGAYEAVLDRVKDADEVVPATVSASSSRPNHPAEAASDNGSDTWWSPRGPGEDATLTFTFDQPTRVVYLSVIPGITDESKQQLRKTGRPKLISVLVIRDDGTTRTDSFELNNEIGQQTTNIATSDAKTVRLTIKEMFPGPNPARGVAILEVEFRARN